MNHLIAYIDGGTGSMALQIVLASGLSLVYAVSSKWALIKSRLFKRGASVESKQIAK